MPFLDLPPSQWSTSQREVPPAPAKKSIWEQMKENSRNYQPPKVTVWTYVMWMFVMAGVYIAKNGWPQ